jgi:hypothetical protein
MSPVTRLHKLCVWTLSSVFTVGLIASVSTPVQAEESPNKPVKEFTFGNLRSTAPEVAKNQAAIWLKSVGKMDQAKFDQIWSAQDVSILDRVSATLQLGSADAAKLIAQASQADANPPKELPALLKDEKQNSFFRSNLALVYAKHLTNHRVYEEALSALKTTTVEQVVDPSAYLFNRAVSEHALIQKKEAAFSIIRLMDEVQDAPERYKMVSAIMFFDIQGWKSEERDLGNIAKLMDNVERRLDLGRGGKETQEIQKKIVFRLDELIKEKESQSKGGQCNGGNCPGGGTKPGKGGGNPTAPQQDSFGGNKTGPGKETETKLRQLTENWGKLNERDRAAAMTEISKELPPKYRVVVEQYFKQLAGSNQ